MDLENKLITVITDFTNIPLDLGLNVTYYSMLFNITESVTHLELKLKEGRGISDTYNLVLTHHSKQNYLSMSVEKNNLTIMDTLVSFEDFSEKWALVYSLLSTDLAYGNLESNSKALDVKKTIITMLVDNMKLKNSYEVIVEVINDSELSVTQTFMEDRVNIKRKNNISIIIDTFEVTITDMVTSSIQKLHLSELTTDNI